MLLDLFSHTIQVEFISPGAQMKKTDIQIRDPFILPCKDEQTYYLFGTTDKSCWGKGTGFDCYRSKDLIEWEGPIEAFRPSESFWATENFWAPEVHFFRGKYYMFATFKAPNRYRGTQILVSDKPEGPYKPFTDGPITPKHWECLDGTFHVDENGRPWIIFCHEWVQIHNGAMYAMPLTDDLTEAAGKPVFLFNASDAAWVTPLKVGNEFRFPCYVTDGPYIIKLSTGKMGMLWSSDSKNGYAMGLAWSESDTIVGPWYQEKEPIWGKDGGHGMIFESFDGKKYLTLHMPNTTPNERPFFFEVKENHGTLQLVQ